MPSLAVKPPRAAVHLELIPPEMKAVPQWLGWNWTKNDKGLFSKPPFSIHTARQCDKTDREQHATFDQAAAAVERFDGLGFAFTPDDDFVFIDLDKCINTRNMEVSADARYVVELANSYTEISPSGTGLKIYIIAKMPDGYRHQDEAKGFEVYHQGAYSCVTGNHFADAPATIRTCSAGDVQRLLDFMFPPPVPVDWKPPKDFSIDDEDLACDALFAISPNYADGYHDWVKVGMAAHATSNSQRMLNAWEAWSQSSDKYAPGECAKKWKSFGTGSRAVTIGTLIHMARENGWSPPWKGNGQPSVNGTASTAKGTPVDYELITASECLRRDYPLEFFIKGVMAKGEPMVIVAPLKACKTLTAADMAISLIKGGHFLGYFPVTRPVPTIMLWGESGWRGVQSNLRRISQAAGATAADLDNLFVGVKLPKFGNPEHARALDREIKRTRAEVVIIDCLYLCGVSGDTAKNQMEMGSLLASIKDVFVENDCTLVLLHHTTKHIPPGEPLQLDNAAFAGVAEFAAQWLLINPQRPYVPGSGHHEHWLTIGGRAGHGGLYGLTIDEGEFVEGQDREWNVTVKTPEEMRQSARDDREQAREADRLEKLQDDKTRVARAMAGLERQHPEGNAATAIRDRSGLKGQRFQDALSALLNDGMADDCEFLRGNHKTPQQGYKLRTETASQ